jgi:hypothetical protein
MPLDRTKLEELLAELDDLLDLADCEPVEWVVCGGAALALQQLTQRTTGDVDLLGRWSPNRMDVISMTEFPEDVQRCIDQVIDSHPELDGFRHRWINLGPTDLVRTGLPGGYQDRKVTRRFGDHLTLHLLGRRDLIALKLYAASDDRGKRQRIHDADLWAMTPTWLELDDAINWIRSRPDFEQVRPTLKHQLGAHGYEDLAYYI